MHNARPHQCIQPCIQGKWSEQVHLPRGSPLGFEWCNQRLDVSLEMLNVYLISICMHILCLVYTVQPLDNNFITCVNIHNYEHFGRKGFDSTACMCNTNQLTHACPTMHQILLVDTLIIPQATQIWCSPATSSEGCSGWQWKGYLNTTHPDQKGLQLQEDAGSSSHWW